MLLRDVRVDFQRLNVMRPQYNSSVQLCRHDLVIVENVASHFTGRIELL